jgi:hypothetical protein
MIKKYIYYFIHRIKYKTYVVPNKFGRLTPIKFDYADNDILSKICKFYYKKNINVNITNKKISTCVLTHFVTESKLDNKSTDGEFEYFKYKLNNHINTNFNLTG